jgi:hypothetical protein
VVFVLSVAGSATDVLDSTVLPYITDATALTVPFRMIPKKIRKGPSIRLITELTGPRKLATTPLSAETTAGAAPENHKSRLLC